MHLAAWYASLTNGSTNLANTVVNDSVLTPSGTTGFILPRPGQIRLVYSAGVSITNVRVNTPSLRYVALPAVGPLNVTLTVPSPPNVVDWGPNAPTLPVNDAITAEHTLGGGAPEVEYTLAWFSFGPRPVPSGPRYRVRFTGTITAAAGTWVNGAMTPDQTLPQGRYAVTGLDAVGTNLVAVRLLFPGTFFRPGCLARNAVSGVPFKGFTDDRLGLWGVFNSINVPTFDIFSSGANTAQTVFMDLVRLGDQMTIAA